MVSPTEYDPRYLAGILFFNRGDYFEAHEVWEDVWRDCSSEDRRFYQGLIQAAVAIYHANRGNWQGTRRLHLSARTYMSNYPSWYRGLDVLGFWKQMDACLREFLGEGEPKSPQVQVEQVPRIELNPPPAEWPNPDSFLQVEESRD
jgi:uncharacterized protein